LNGGSLFGTGTLAYGVVDGATITPGDSATKTGALAVSGTYAQNAAGALDVTIGGITAGTQYDQINVSSTASLNGKLNISLAAGFTPTIGSTFNILNASSVTGTFSSVTGTSINGSEHFTVTYNGNDVILTVVSGAAPAGNITLTGIKRPGLEHGHYGRTVSLPAIAHLPAAAPTPAVIRTLAGGRSFRPKDEIGLTAVTTTPSSNNANAIAPVSAPAVNPMAAMNHLHFECGVSLNALRHTTGKRLIKALWASPDSPDAVNIGYMVMTPAR